MPRRRVVVGLLLVGAGAAGAVGYAVSADRSRPARPVAGPQPGTGTVVGGNPSASPGPRGTPAGPTGTFSIEGQVAGLLPGRPATLALTVTNPNPWPIQVLTLDTGVTAPPGTTCPAESLRVGRYTFTGGTRYAAPARGTVVVPVSVELADSPTADQSGCRGEAFPLTFTGTAEKVTR